MTPEVVAVFRQASFAGSHDPYELSDLRIAMAAALGRSKFCASPLDREPSSLIVCEVDSPDVALELRARLLKEIGKRRLFMKGSE